MLHTYIDHSVTYLQDIKTNYDVNELFAVYFVCMVNVK